MGSRGVVLVAVEAFLWGCRSEQPPGSVEDASGLPGISGMGTASTGEDPTTSGGILLDFGGGDSGTGNKPDGTEDDCRKVDLLFVIDNSASFEDEQVNLVASFPGFIATLQAKLETIDSYHVGITTTDANNCLPSPCNTAGALVTETCGEFSSNTLCGPYVEGSSYMTEADDLASKFACAAQVGTDGSYDEQPMHAMSLATSPAHNAPGACNEGFIRDDALLVVVIITDEEDDHEMTCQGFPGSPGEPGDWYATVVGHKGGIESNVVVLALVGPPAPDDCAPRMCNEIDGAEIGTRIIEFTTMFTHGFVGQVCASSYDDFFAEAVGVIDSACEEFVPPG